MRSSLRLLAVALLAPLLALLPAWGMLALGDAHLEADRALGLRLHRSAEEDSLVWALFTFLAALWGLYAGGYLLLHQRRLGLPLSQPGAAAILRASAVGFALLVGWCLLFLGALALLNHAYTSAV